jgi:hypothetical protein
MFTNDSLQDWIYLLLAAGVIGALQTRSWRRWVIVAPPLLNALVIATFVNAPEARYVYPALIAGQLFGLFLASPIPAPNCPGVPAAPPPAPAYRETPA